MRLLVTALGIAKQPTGLGVYAEMVVPLLCRLDAEVVVVTWTGVPLIGGQAVEAGPPPHGSGALTAARRVLWSNARLDTLARKVRADAVLHLLPEVGRVSVPQLIVVHDLIPLVAPTTWRQRLYFRTVVASSVRAAAGIIADSFPTRADLMHLFGTPTTRISVVPAGVDLEYFRPRPTSTARAAYLIAVGTHAPHKRLDLLLHAYAWSSVRRTHELYVVGPTSRYTPALQSLARDLGIADRTRWLSYVDRERLAGLYASADAYVSFSVSEGFGLPALEALACGTPILVTNVGAAQEFRSDKATIILSSSGPDELASGLEAIATRAHQRGVREAARAVAERFPWERTASELLEVAKRVAARGA